MISGDEAKRADAGDRNVPATGEQPYVTANTSDLGRGWFSKLVWFPTGPGIPPQRHGDTEGATRRERFFDGYSRDDAISRAVQYAEKVLGYDRSEVLNG